MAGDFQKINIPNVTEDKPGGYRRQYPRRVMKRRVGVLCAGSYFTVDSGEIGEGGMSIISEFLLNDGDEVVVSFQIPNGEFTFLRGVVRSTQKKQGDSKVTHGLSFSNITFGTKRQIRAFVSARN